MIVPFRKFVTSWTVYVSWLLEHFLCWRFRNSTFKLYEWACISYELASQLCVLWFTYDCFILHSLTSLMMIKHTEKFEVSINSIRLCISWTGLHHDQFTFYVYQESGGTKHGVPADAREFHIWIKKNLVLVNNSPFKCSHKFLPCSSTIKLN